MEKNKKFLERERNKVKIKRRVERCRNCSHSYLRYRTKQESWICHSCGFSWTTEEEMEYQRIEDELTERDFQLRYQMPLSLNRIEEIIEEEEREVK